jgi:SAM-dependent methyltransferase
MSNVINIDTIANSFGIEPKELGKKCEQLLEDMDTGYEIVSGIERDTLIAKILKKIEKDEQVIGAPDRTNRWFEGWKENLDELRASGYNTSSLMPKFIRKNQPIRFMGDYIIPNESHFEHAYFNIFRTWLFEKYFSDYSSIYDIGCGSSYNLIKLCEMYPEKKIYGLDFVQSSVDIVDELSKNKNLNAEGRLFNLIEPDFDMELDDNSLVFTSGAIEQIASKYDNFINFLLEKKPKLVVHVEPTYEVYEQEVLFDYLAAKFHKKRGYTMGYLPKLKQLEKDGKIEILKIKRLNFGSLYMEGFTNIIWRPL